MIFYCKLPVDKLLIYKNRLRFFNYYTYNLYYCFFTIKILKTLAVDFFLLYILCYKSA